MLQERVVKKTSAKIPSLGFGVMRLPITNSGDIDYEKATKLVNYAIDNGIRFIDTAYNFHDGKSETFLSTILKKRRKDILLSTKLPIWFTDKEEDFQKYLNTQLKRLKTNYIDYYFLHNLKYEKFKELKNENIINFLDKIKEEKKVKYVGFSFHGKYKEFKNIVNAYNWDACILQHNYLDNKKLKSNKSIDYAASKGMAVIIMQPLKGGILANNTPIEVEDILNEEEITEEPSEWALKWILNNPNVTCILSGMTTIKEIKQNINTVNKFSSNIISKKELKTYKEVRNVYDKLVPVQCTNCGNCMPCPLNVDIPKCFSTYNKKVIFNSGIKDYISKTAILNSAYASLCLDCGACISKCPQNIMIPEELKYVKKDMEFPGFKYVMKIIEKVTMPLSNISEEKKRDD